MISKIISLASLCLIFGFTFFKKGDTLVVDLHQESNEVIPTNEYPAELHLKTLDRYPKFKKHLLETSVGIPASDSLSFYYRQSSSMSFDAYKSGDISKEEFLRFLDYVRLDSLELSKVKFLDNLIFVVGFKDDKQFIIADVNRNKDFSDDIKYEFEINFRNNTYDRENYLAGLKVSNYNYKILDNGKNQEFNRKFILYPDKYNLYSMVNGEKGQNYFSIFRFKDFWKGTLTIDKQIIEFYYCGISNEYGHLYVKPKEIHFSFADKYSNSQFMHKLTDVIPIAGGYYVVDSINTNISKLYLRKTGNKSNSHGNTIGTSLKKLDFKDLENNPFNTHDIIGRKKYTLIEFWGTWCGPCRKLTPSIKKASIDYASKLSIISVAVDNNKTAVKDYVLKNEMNWKNAYLSYKEKNKDLTFNEFEIQYFPTFILLDSKGKILHRGSSDSFVEILKLIK